MLTAFVIGPICSSLTLREYFLSPLTYDYIRQSLRTLGDWNLPGVFSYASTPLAAVVNGSLWTLRYEALSYLVLLVLFVALSSLNRVTLFMTVLAVAISISDRLSSLVPSLSFTLPYFAGGVLMYWLSTWHPFSSRVFLICLMGLVLSASIGLQKPAFAVFGAYLIVYMGQRRNFLSDVMSRTGDFSYGLYLYGWPAQQIAMQILGATSPLVLFFVSVPIAFVPSIASFTFVEKPALAAKNRARSIVDAALKRLMSIPSFEAKVGFRFARIAFILSSLLVIFSKEQWFWLADSVLAISVISASALILVGFLWWKVKSLLPVVNS